MAKEVRAAPRKQHFVPQFYLRGFVGEKGQLFVIDRPSQKTFRTAPKNVAAERDFNRVDVEGMDPNAVEKALAEFEGKVAPAFDRVKAAKSLDNKEDRDTVMNLICALTIRNPRQRATISDFIGEVAQRVAKIGLETKERWESQVAQMKEAGIWDDSSNVSYDDMKKFVEERRYKIEIAKEFNVAMEIEQHGRLLQHLGKRKWQILVANERTGGFVTTDVPVCITWSDGRDHGIFSPGFGVRGTEVIVPISTNLALRGTFEGEEDVVEADIFTVGNVNSILISNAEKQVYAHDYSFNYLRSFPQEIGSGATLVDDEKFLAGGEKPEEGKIVTLRTK
jgi:Protein of unknown function (DUF4238)